MDWRKNLISVIERKQLQGVIFDFDGTLYNLPTNWNGLKNELTTRFQFSPQTSLHAMLTTIKTRDGAVALQEAYRIIETFEKENVETVKMHKDILVLLETLHKKTKLAIFSSNMTNTIKLVLQNNNAEKYFDIVLGKDTVSNYKPYPEGVEKILKTWSVGPSNVIFVGDSDFDKQTAENSGVEFLLI